jgi:capsular polysaccharide biosynthesis protein
MEQQIKGYSDEINLYDFWKAIIKRKRLIVGIFLIAVISTTVISFLMPKIYRGEAVINILLYEAIPAKELSDMIGKIDKEKRKYILSKTYSSVSDITFKTMKDSKDKVIVIIDAKNVDDIPKILSELVDYLNNIGVVKLNVNEEKERLEKKSTELSNVIYASTGLLDTYHNLLKSGKLLPVGFNPIDLNRKVADIKLEKLAVEQAILRLKDGGIGIASQLYISNIPVKPKKTMNMVSAGVASFFVGIFLAFSLEYVEKIKSGCSA